MSRHLKRYAAPASWTIDRKTTMWITKPASGPHSIATAMPLVQWMRKLGLGTTLREIRKILLGTKVLVDGRRIKNPRFPVGLFDSISIPEGKVSAIISLDKKGRLTLESANDTDKKPCRIQSKTTVRGGKTQVHLSDGRTLRLEKAPYAVGDTLVIETPSNKISSHITLKEGTTVLLTGGGHVGKKGTVNKIEGQKIWCSGDGETVETRKEFAYPIP